tara:strand:- start:351 stop:674 length:324 start_codon:yes stop_codon:yes gene_type:complete
LIHKPANLGGEMIVAKELIPLCHYIRETIVHALGGEPNDFDSDNDLENYIENIDINILNQLHDLIVMLDYFYALVLANQPLGSEARELLDTANRLIIDVKQMNELSW